MYLFGTLFTLPTATSAIASMGDWSSNLFTEFLPIIWMLVGIAVVMLLIRLFIGLFRH